MRALLLLALLAGCNPAAAGTHYDRVHYDNGGLGLKTNILTEQIECTDSVGYCAIFSHTPRIASSGVPLYAFILIDPNSTSVAPQFRVSTTDAGYSGICTWTLYPWGAGTTAPTIDNIVVGTAPTDTADTGWGTANQHVAEVRCALLADADPGPISVEWQLETGSTPTQAVLAGSYLITSN